MAVVQWGRRRVYATPWKAAGIIPSIVLCVCYEMSGTELGSGTKHQAYATTCAAQHLDEHALAWRGSGACAVDLAWAKGLGSRV
eukprot:2747011-Rhodomonas_salina.1